MAEAKKKGKGKRILKAILVLILLLVLMVGGVSLGIYLRIFGTQTMNEKRGLYSLPVVGQYVVKPAPKEPENTPVVENTPPTVDESKQKQKDLQLSQKELEKQQKEREAAEKKRVSKLARLYNAMKPKDAADAMDTLDDDLCILILQRMDEDQAAQVMSAFTPDKAGRLTRLMYEGRRQRLVSPEDQQNGAQAANGENGENSTTQQ